MIETTLGIIDRLISLAKYREERLKNKYRELVKPIFDDLMLVHLDYLKLFEHVVARIRACTDQTQLEDTIEFLRQGRLEFEPVRTKLKALSDHIHSHSSGSPYDFDMFIYSIKRYFRRGSFPATSSRASWIVARLDASAERWKIISDEISFEELQALREDVEGGLLELRQDWSGVCETYARMTLLAAKRLGA